MGGVEMHIYSLGVCLLQRGHKVVVVTHSYGTRTGVRYLHPGLKVYYIPLRDVYQQTTFPTVVSNIGLYHSIFVREQIELVHAHQAFSTLSHEMIFVSNVVGLPTVFTDHSLFGFADASSILMNKILKLTLAGTRHAICVSHTGKENTVLRGAFDPYRVSVIPNAADSSVFFPNPGARDPSRVTVVVVSRLAYRKGIDLLVSVIPRLCQMFPTLHFIIGGDGPMRINLEEMRERHNLHERVEMLGALHHTEVQPVLTRGDIFLNSSLTEAFCTAVLEAASCGLVVVSTCVGGVPEVLPDDMVHLARPEPNDMVGAVCAAIERVQTNRVDPSTFHSRLKQMYSWANVAERTERVYTHVLQSPQPSLLDKLHCYSNCGPFAGKLFCCMFAFVWLVWKLLQLLDDSHTDICPEFPPPVTVAAAAPRTGVRRAGRR
eukprot:TRINITY_DN4564_c0_g1_i2.p1 TRINITY_DN4564_c0_g1~~TRINITY_DN4564_c0_g1_i2.p1  ORF type:complete len:448 (-),score=121.24 TRINITY_DN4564_c0_g1_i2:47-1342(-)